MRYVNLDTRYERSEDKVGWKIRSPGAGVVWVEWHRPELEIQKTDETVCPSRSVLYTLYHVKNKKQCKNMDKSLRRSFLDSHNFVTYIKQTFNTNLTFEYEKRDRHTVIERSVLFNRELFNRCEKQLDDNWCEWFTIGVNECRVINTPLYHHIGFKNKEDKLKFILLM